MSDMHNDTRSLRTCYVRGDADGMLGLHLSRAPWDPYPWVSGVQSGSSAAIAGIKVGDCVLEVNGADVLGERIVEVADRIRSNWRTSTAAAQHMGSGAVRLARATTAADAENGVTFLLWNSKAENNLNPHSLQKFTNCLQSVAQLLECPVCLDVVKPPAFQCCHGHVICAVCRARSTRCPVCRVTFGPRGRCLVADKLFTLLAETFPCDSKATSKDTKERSHCSPSAPCSRNTHTANHHHHPKSKSSPKSGAALAKPNEPCNTLRLHCPTGKACSRLMPSVHELLTHLQKAHRTTVTQYYASLGDRTVVKFGSDRTIASVAIAKNGLLELFMVVRARISGDEDACWIWYVGDGATAAAYHVRLESGRTKWKGVAHSLESSVKDVLAEESIGPARRYLGIETMAGSVVVEIK